MGIKRGGDDATKNIGALPSSAGAQSLTKILSHREMGTRRRCRCKLACQASQDVSNLNDHNLIILDFVRGDQRETLWVTGLGVNFMAGASSGPISVCSRV